MHGGTMYIFDRMHTFARVDCPQACDGVVGDGEDKWLSMFSRAQFDAFYTCIMANERSECHECVVGIVFHAQFTVPSADEKHCR
jgi:hypothetical protein